MVAAWSWEMLLQELRSRWIICSLQWCVPPKTCHPLSSFVCSCHLTKQIHFRLQCFYARLGFVQPPSCLKCAHRKAVKKTDDGASCNNLVPWRRDANIPLHPDGLGDNLVFVTCETAKRLIGGDAYPSIQWDSKNRRILHEM